MKNGPTSETSQTLSRRTARRGNFYYGLGFALLVGLVVVVGLGVLGIPSLGILEVSTAMAMIAIAITMLSIVTFVTLVTLRRTFLLLDHHEKVLSEQATRVSDLAAQVQARWRAEQVIRDRNQDADLATVSARQDASFVAGQVRLERDRAARVVVRPAPARRGATSDPFHGGKVYPVREIEGVGEHYGKLLESKGLHDTQQLWNADATYVARGLQVTPTEVAKWQSMAELMAVNGIGKQYAELLVRADVSGIDELCAESAQPLLNRIHRLEAHHIVNRIQGNTIGIKIVKTWIEAAQAYHGVAPTGRAVVGHNGPEA